MSNKLAVASSNDKPSQEEAMEAVKTLIRWAGDDPEREGLIEIERIAVVIDQRTGPIAGIDLDLEV